MKTYPFLKVLINLYWLLLLIVIGLFAVTISNAFLAEETDEIISVTTASKTNLSTVPPELLGSVTAGKKLFRTNFATCHNKNMKSDMTGPALAGVRERWSAYPESDLYTWIKNSTKLVEAEHPKALEVYTKWNKVAMPSFSNMTEEEVKAILDYVESVK